MKNFHTRSVTEISPFGMLMPGRSYKPNNSSYRFGFGGHEKDDKVKGSGNHLCFGDYGYDTRLGRRWNVEPLIHKYPSFSSYMVFANNPIIVTDPDGREIRLVFKSDAARDAYINTVNKSLGGTTKISIISVKDVHGYTNKIVLTSTGMNGPLTETQQAFSAEYSAVVNDKAIVRQNIVQSDKETVVGSYYTGKVDMADIAEFDKAGAGAASSAGALIHETVEQLGKAKLGLLPNEWSKTVGTDKIPPEFESTHKTATDAENKVNGNTRKEAKGYFLERNGTKTKQDLTPNSSGGVDIKKTKIK